MGLVLPGVKKAGSLYGCLRDALGECAQRRFSFDGSPELEVESSPKLLGTNLQSGSKVY